MLIIRPVNIIKNNKWAGFEYNGTIYIDLSAVVNSRDAIKIWLHENIQAEVKKRFDNKEAREAFLIQLYDIVGVEEINKFIPFDYHKLNKIVKANEFIAFLGQKYAENKENDIPDDLKKIIFGVVNNIINLNTLKNVISNNDLRSNDRSILFKVDGGTERASTGGDRLKQLDRGNTRVDETGEQRAESLLRSELPASPFSGFVTENIDQYEAHYNRIKDVVDKFAKEFGVKIVKYVLMTNGTTLC